MTTDEKKALFDATRKNDTVVFDDSFSFEKGYRLGCVELFSKLMLKKLQSNISKGSWRNDDPWWLLSRLEDEVRELKEAMDTQHKNRQLSFGDKAADDIIGECVDVANFAMMIADVVMRR